MIDEALCTVCADLYQLNKVTCNPLCTLCDDMAPVCACHVAQSGAHLLVILWHGGAHSGKVDQ
jgi:hypothetical protein